jgi:hypothetical protein
MGQYGRGREEMEKKYGEVGEGEDFFASRWR